MPVQHRDLLILPGVTSVVDALVWSICNEGDGIILPTPFYSGFSADCRTRARAIIVPAYFQAFEDYRGFDDVFDAERSLKALEKAFGDAEGRGIRVRAVILTK